MSLICLAAGLMIDMSCETRTSTSDVCVVDLVEQRALRNLADFTGWLDRTDSFGYVGEVGWPVGPDAARWQHVAESWFERADKAQLWVTTWGASEWWPADYPMAVWRGPQLSLPGPQADVVQRHANVGAVVRGIGVPTGAFGAMPATDTYSNVRPGQVGQDYNYESVESFQRLARAGMHAVRLSVTWERLQRRLGDELSGSAVDDLRAAMRRADAAGLKVIVDLHNYGEYHADAGGGGVDVAKLGDPTVDTAFADLWFRLATALRGQPGLLGFGLMNEPHGLGDDGARAWERASQAAVSAIRRSGDDHVVLVSGYRSAFAGAWSQVHPQAWIDDPAHAVRYETHQYFDADNSGRYALSYAAELAAVTRSAPARGCGAPAPSTR